MQNCSGKPVRGRQRENASGWLQTGWVTVNSSPRCTPELHASSVAAQPALLCRLLGWCLVLVLVYHQLPEAPQQHRLGSVCGAEGLRILSNPSPYRPAHLAARLPSVFNVTVDHLHGFYSARS